MDIRNQILWLTDNMPPMNKAAFYSDPYVEQLVAELHHRWEEANHQGEPIEYASEEELKKLLKLAKYYYKLPFWKAYKMVRERTEGRPIKESKD